MHHSRAITRKSASNLALAFVLLPREKRDGMSALYAFCREIDDIADDEALPLQERRDRLAAWRKDIAIACKAGAPSFPTNRELKPVIARHALRFELFDELIRGVEMDLDIKRYETFADLEVYCYRVASVVGLLSIEIFGYTNPACRTYADHLGKALQLTNILRDVRVDAECGRIYLPLAELARHNVSESDVLAYRYSPEFRAVAEAVAARARYHYEQARQALPPQDRRSMGSAELMGSVYWKLLRKLEKQQFNVFGPEPMRLSRTQKIVLIARTWCRIFFGVVAPNYGV